MDGSEREGGRRGVRACGRTKRLRLTHGTGHSHIDFLRLDVEGWEWETFRGIVRDFTMERGNPGSPPPANANSTATGWSIAEREGVLPFGQLQIELHVWKQRFQDFLEWWELLETSGLRPFHSEVRRPTGPLGLLFVAARERLTRGRA